MCMLYELMPDEFRAHRRAARRERLLAWRALLDSAIERLAEPPAAEESSDTPRTARSEFWAHHRAARREDMLACRSLFSGCLLGAFGGHRRPAAPVTPSRIEIV